MAREAELSHAEGDIGSATPGGTRLSQRGSIPPVPAHKHHKTTAISTPPPIFCFFAGRNSGLFRPGGIKHWKLKNFAGKNGTKAWNKPERLLFSRLGLHTLQLAASLE